MMMIRCADRCQTDADVTMLMMTTMLVMLSSIVGFFLFATTF
jgi:hypothetical protein